MSVIVSPTIRGLKGIQRILRAESKRQKQAVEIAVRAEGYRLRRVIKESISSGKAGSFSFRPLSMIARKMRHRKKPLLPLRVAVRYAVGNKPFQVRVGFPGTFMGMDGRFGALSKSWRRIAYIQQKGFTTPVTPYLRQKLAAYGASLSKRSSFRKYFFLKKTTTHLRTPARPIISPIWAVEQSRTIKNIESNYKRKMAGERI